MRTTSGKGANNIAWKGGIRLTSCGYIREYLPSHPRSQNGAVLQHILISEKVLGRPLRNNEQVHHIDGNGKNNKKDNLVLCEDNSYHSLIHKRERALKHCGHASWLKCKYCKKYDDPKNLELQSKKAEGIHRKCANKYMRAYRAKLKMKIRKGVIPPDTIIPAG